MAVKQLTMDCAVGRSGGLSLFEPTWTEVQASIERLNQDTCSLLLLYGPGETRMVIGGGAGRYTVSYFGDGPAVGLVLVAPERRGTEPLVAGARIGDYSSQAVVDLATAIAAAHHFDDEARPDPALEWRPLDPTAA